MRRTVLWLGLIAMFCGSSAASAASSADDGAEIIFDGGLRGAWQDWGWAHRQIEAGAPAQLHMNNYAGWILANRGLQGSFSALSFEFKAPHEFGDFLEVRLAAEGDDSFKHVTITPQYCQTNEAGWMHARISMTELNPGASPFDRVVFHAQKSVAETAVHIDKIKLHRGALAALAPVDISSYKAHGARLKVDCRAPSHLISPLVYGTAFNPQRVGQDDWLWELGTTARRWGGNNTSRYNWQLGNAWNCAFDWFYKNANYTNDPHYSWKDFLKENSSHKVATALTVPMLGWVAKDTQSASFPVSTYGPQQYQSGDAGNGKRGGGQLIDSPDPTQTSVAASSEFMRAWVHAIRAYDRQQGARSVQQYILDNEPALWNSTHRDVHPKALTYDELLQRSIDYGTAIRREDPQALIAGPAEWGWPAYFFSARDAEVGFSIKPDRRSHGDRPLLEWYLSRLQQHAKKTGTRILDIVDLHFYPQEDGIYGHAEKTDPASAALRLRATRSLWDPTYKDESWINERIKLLPRMAQMIASNYPGLKMSIGEYNFGGERHISGGLAQAEALGRFGEYGVYSAFYWTYPPRNSNAFHAFRAFRNYDGHGAHFLDRSMAAQGDAKTSIFASQNETGDRMVLIVLNFDFNEAAAIDVDLGSCGAWQAGPAFTYTGGPHGMAKASTAPAIVAGALSHKVAPASITVYELRR